MDELDVPEVIEGVIYNVSVVFVGKISYYELEDFRQEGYLKWLLFPKKRYNTFTHCKNAFSLSFKNHLLNLIKHDRHSTQQMPDTLTLSGSSYNSGELSVLLLQAPPILQEVMDCVCELIEDRKKITNQIVCKKMNLCPSHHNPIREFKKYVQFG